MSSTGSHFECFIPQLVALFGKDSENLRKWGPIEVCHSRSARGDGFSLAPPTSEYNPLPQAPTAMMFYPDTWVKVTLNWHHEPK